MPTPTEQPAVVVRARAQPGLGGGDDRSVLTVQTAPPLLDAQTSRTPALAARLAETRRLTDVLAEPLSPEDQTIQSMPDVSPTKWHRAHTTWFFETFVLGSTGTHRPFEPAYGYLFNSYYETVGPRHPRAERGLLSRPGAAEIGAYRRHVDEAMARALDGGLGPDALALVELGIHHEQQHQELLLMDIKHVLSVNPLRPAYRRIAGPPTVAERAPRWIEHPGGLVEVGHAGGGFAFDNESPRHRVHLEPFAVADRLVSCRDWMAFIDDGGYRTPQLWLSEGWATVSNTGWDAPLYWRRGDHAWEVFTLGGIRPVDPAEPVCHVSYFEADAFARWADARLPTEAEWETVASTQPGDEVTEGDGFLDLDHLHPRAVPAGGPPRLSGQVWQWTSSAYLPYPRFRPPLGAVGEYNGKFMVNQHVLRGGSCVTPVGHHRPTYRNFFPPSARWPFAGLRLATDR